MTIKFKFNDCMLIIIMSKNFSLRSRKNKVNQTQSTQLSNKSKFKATSFDSEDVNKMTQGYKIVQENQWQTLPKNTHVRYLLKSGKFRRGGFIQNTYLQHGKVFFMLQTNPVGDSGQKNIKWPVAFEDLQTLYQRDSVVSIPEHKEYNTHQLPNSQPHSQPHSQPTLSEFGNLSMLELRLDRVESNIKKNQTDIQQILDFIYKQAYSNTGNSS